MENFELFFENLSSQTQVNFQLSDVRGNVSGRKFPFQLLLCNPNLWSQLFLLCISILEQGTIQLNLEVVI